MATTNDSILPKVMHCLSRFGHMLTVGLPNHVPLSFWEDELGRLRIWVANNDAFQTAATSGQQSLDDRLRDASHIKTQVVRQLDRLSRILDDLNALRIPGFQESSDSESEDFPEDLRSSTIRAYRNLVGSIDSLYQMSLLIRKPAPYDGLAATPFSEGDIKHEIGPGQEPKSSAHLKTKQQIHRGADHDNPYEEAVVPPEHSRGRRRTRMRSYWRCVRIDHGPLHTAC